MVDPVTAIAAATSAFSLIKKGFDAGRDIESMYSDMGRWMGAVSDIRHADQMNKNPSVFKKLFNGSSIEQEAMDIFAAKKKAEEMEYELKQYIMFTHGASAWDELIRMQGKIRKERQQMIYARQKQREKIINIIICTVGIGLIVALLGWFAWFVFQTSYLFAGFR